MAKVAFTAGRINSFKCPLDKKQAFLWDATARGLGLRASPEGRLAYVFQAVFDGKDVRVTIGSPEVWNINQAQAKARELKRMIDEGIDPRSLKREALASSKAEMQRVQETKRATITVAEAWSDYLKKRKPFWGELHYRDHIDKAKTGGLLSAKRGANGKLTKEGPLACLMPIPLKDLDQAKIEMWATNEGKTRPASARLAWRLLTVFLTWCSEQPEYTTLLDGKNPAKTKNTREALGKASQKSDVLQREQLAAWFSAVQQLQNPVISACLQVMLLTGARRGEVLGLRWEDINTQWKGINIRDKIEGKREIPATPYILHLISALPRRNEWVFSSPTSKSGRLTEPNAPHTRACSSAGIEGLTIHGLRRSFSTLTEWLEIPTGVVAQIQGHKPSATAEKHYKRRPLDLLRLHHERIESWILEQAGVAFDSKKEASHLSLVSKI